MACKKPAAYQQSASDQSTQLKHDISKALGTLLGQDNIGQWTSDHFQKDNVFQGRKCFAIAASGRWATRAHGYSAGPREAAKRKAPIRRCESIWQSMAQDGLTVAVSDENWVADVDQLEPQDVLQFLKKAVI